MSTRKNRQRIEFDLSYESNEVVGDPSLLLTAFVDNADLYRPNYLSCKWNEDVYENFVWFQQGFTVSMEKLIIQDNCPLTCI